MTLDIIRRCRFSPYLKGKGPIFHLTMWDTGRTDSSGMKSRLGYKLVASCPHLTKHSKHGERWTVFEGEDFCASPLHAIDSDETVAALMSFLTLRPGDTDREYFDGYTEVQKAFCEQDAETLGNHVAMQYGDA